MLVAELLSANPAPFQEAQAEQGAEIEGQVVDQQGAPVVEAKLRLVGAADAGMEATDTDQAGRFRIRRCRSATMFFVRRRRASSRWNTLWCSRLQCGA